MAEELKTLFDLAEKQGIAQAEIVTSIKAAVAAEYQKRYPDAAKAITVLVDTHGGYIRILAEDKDITPAEFAPEAARLARQVVVGYIKKEEKPPPQPPDHKTADLLLRFLFYGYNGLSLFYLAIFLLGLLSESLRELLAELLRQKGAFGFVVLTILVFTPIGSVYAAFRYGLSKRPQFLTKLLFLFEIPTVLLALFLFGTFTQPLPAIWLFSVVLLALPFIFFMKTTGIKVKEVWELMASFVTKEVVFLASVYLGLLYCFFFPLFIAGIVKEIFEIIESFFRYGSLSVGDLIPFLIFLPFVLAGLLFLTFLTFLPYIVLFFATKMFVAAREEVGKRLGEERMGSWTAITLLVAALLVVISSYQADASWLLARLEAFAQAASFEQREELARELAPHEGRIKQAVEDAIDARRRYFLTKDHDFLSRTYHELFSLPTAAADTIQAGFTILASPFVYRGPTDMNGQLSTAYQDLFGKSIWEVSYPAKFKQPENVRLLSRKVQVKTDSSGLLAKVSVEEEYENTSYSMEEVIYEFSLPSEAAVFALRLGPDLEHQGVIAPRGAAREVYEEELRKSRDPALLEQTGPRQYRLRVFPIPGKNDSRTLNGKNQRVMFAYAVGAASEGLAELGEGYPLPKYVKEQNVFTDTSTDISYSVDGSQVSASVGAQFIGKPAGGRAEADPCTSTTILSSDDTIEGVVVKLVPHLADERIEADFACDRSGKIKLLGNIANQKIALLYDVSYQNRDNRSARELREFLAENRQFVAANRVDLYLFNDRLSSARALSATLKNDLNLVYFGKSDLAKALGSFNGFYDMAAIVVYSDEEAAVFTPQNLPQARFPIYLVQASNAIPAYSNELTRFVLQSGGQVTDSFSEAVNHFAISQRLQKEVEKELLFVGPYWSIRAESFFNLNLPPILVGKTLTVVENDALGYLAARAYILNKLASYTGSLEYDKAFLDELNQLAEERSVVTPYSSLIALVTAEQRERLEQEKGELDRYEVRREEMGMIRRPQMLPNIVPDMGLGFGSFFGAGAPMMEMRMIGGDLAAPGGIAMDAGAGVSLPFVWPLIVISGLLAVGGVTVFVIWEARAYLARRKKLGIFTSGRSN